MDMFNLKENIMSKSYPELSLDEILAQVDGPTDEKPGRSELFPHYSYLTPLPAMEIRTVVSLQKYVTLYTRQITIGSNGYVMVQFPHADESCVFYVPPSLLQRIRKYKFSVQLLRSDKIFPQPQISIVHLCLHSPAILPDGCLLPRHIVPVTQPIDLDTTDLRLYLPPTFQFPLIKSSLPPSW